MKILVFAIILVFAAGCTTAIKESSSIFDGSQHIELEPKWLYGGSNLIRLGLFWNTGMEPDKIILDVVIKDTDTIAAGLLQ